MAWPSTGSSAALHRRYLNDAEFHARVQATWQQMRRDGGWLPRLETVAEILDAHDRVHAEAS